MAGGRLVALETVEALHDTLAGQVRMRLTIENPDGRWREAALSAGARDVAADGSTVTIVSSGADRLKILRAIEAAGGVITHFSTFEPTLEDIYLNYIHASKAAGY